VQYARAKGFDTFSPIGPCIAVSADPSNLAIEGWVNGEKRQSSNTNQLIFPVPELVEFVSRFCTLEPGDVITTGTPSGVGPLQPGDRVMVKLERVGTLGNPCVAA
jgi:2-keto-4-pentenoate hydratase/2-oxohepta-3-ene-1,7-dioic acid hydratase in catechol pathway